MLVAVTLFPVLSLLVFCCQTVALSVQPYMSLQRCQFLCLFAEHALLPSQVHSSPLPIGHMQPSSPRPHNTGPDAASSATKTARKQARVHVVCVMIGTLTQTKHAHLALARTHTHTCIFIFVLVFIFIPQPSARKQPNKQPI
jgi:hypothetical protein